MATPASNVWPHLPDTSEDALGHVTHRAGASHMNDYVSKIDNFPSKSERGTPDTVFGAKSGFLVSTRAADTFRSQVFYPPEKIISTPRKILHSLQLTSFEKVEQVKEHAEGLSNTEMFGMLWELLGMLRNFPETFGGDILSIFSELLRSKPAALVEFFHPARIYSLLPRKFEQLVVSQPEKAAEIELAGCRLVWELTLIRSKIGLPTRIIASKLLNLLKARARSAVKSPVSLSVKSYPPTIAREWLARIWSEFPKSIPSGLPAVRVALYWIGEPASKFNASLDAKAPLFKILANERESLGVRKFLRVALPALVCVVSSSPNGHSSDLQHVLGLLISTELSEELVLFLKGVPTENIVTLWTVFCSWSPEHTPPFLGVHRGKPFMQPVLLEFLGIFFRCGMTSCQLNSAKGGSDPSPSYLVLCESLLRILCRKLKHGATRRETLQILLQLAVRDFSSPLADNYKLSMILAQQLPFLERLFALSVPAIPQTPEEMKETQDILSLMTELTHALHCLKSRNIFRPQSLSVFVWKDPSHSLPSDPLSLPVSALLPPGPLELARLRGGEEGEALKLKEEYEKRGMQALKNFQTLHAIASWKGVHQLQESTQFNEGLEFQKQHLASQALEASQAAPVTTPTGGTARGLPKTSSVGEELALRRHQVGIQNFNNTCYLSSFLQCLFLTNAFLAGIFAFDLEQEKVDDDEDSEEAENLVEGLKLLFARLLLTWHPRIEISDFLQGLPPSYRSGEQQDATESARWILDKMGGSEGKWIHDTFSGEIVHKIQCGTCGFMSERKEKGIDVGLSVPKEAEALASGQAVSVQSLFDDFFKEEEMTGDNKYFCDSCNAKRDAKRWTEILSPPPHLLVTLNRFSFDLESCTYKKEMTLVSTNGGEEGMGPPLILKGRTYKLYAAVMHQGDTAMKGHYVAVGKFAEDYGDNGWALYDDSEVHPLHDGASVERVLSGASKPSETAYLMLYRAVDAHPSPLPRIPHPIVEEAKKVETDAVHL